MKVLIADDESVTRHRLESFLRKWGYDFFACSDGTQAWQELQSDKPHPELAILDWEMPGVDGPELCRRIRQTPDLKTIYVLLVTSRNEKEDIIKGLDSGASDYLTKPVDKDELYARLKVGVRTVELQNELTQLKGLFPICSYCKKIRNDKNYWEQVESYISKYSKAQFSHGICPECYDKYLKDGMEESG